MDSPANNHKPDTPTKTWKPATRENLRSLAGAHNIGCLLSLLGGILIFIHPAFRYLFLCGVGLILLVALASLILTIGKIFFTWGQVRLLELILTVAVTGNALGGAALLLKWLALDALATDIVVYSFASLYGVGCAAWSIWVVTVNRHERTWDRVRVFLLSWMAPPACYGVTVAPIHILYGTATNSGITVIGLLLAGGVFLASLYTILGALDLYGRSLLEQKWMKLNALDQPPTPPA